ncbi:50S ribosomal protein L11 methyltransferase [Muriicola sp. Z0-33]|uniref:50S ribosomal protein L11 methyltransferase n=1 Tax=Muriicola sp. Z0-33 TaxID=2816957 RepID=UPI002237F519|nr:50S ribosomal protein L11 methyltransferase [Muriicola sp. Z0-33]MCW5517856.1 50S ribosomal protein L11 methyltransferase [Muriicola sp. Z0-33]
MSAIFLEFSFSVSPLQPGSDILMAELGELPFDSFVETADGIKAYIKKTDFREGMLNEVYILSQPDIKIEFSTKEIAQQNWNAQWEKDFKAITIDNKCIVRAPFHKVNPDVEFDIEIMPKMSFGTGHHETTHMMLQFVLEQEVGGQSVLDMGSGTAVLAILAAMKGAATIDAIDIDHWSFLNAIENAERNGQQHINVFEGDVSLLGAKKYNLILANINRNILLADIPAYAKQLSKKGKLILSGFYLEDLPLITESCERSGLSFVEYRERKSWAAAVYQFLG